MKEIPMMFCFDKNYVIPASVAFYSMLEHASKKYKYILNILHTDISKEDQENLIKTLQPFANNYEIKFINMNNKFDDIWKKLKSKVHFSKEVLYKLLVASLFPQYDKIIVSDVDVVFLEDISASYFSLDVDKDKCYLAGVKQLGFLKNFNNVYDGKFTDEEIKSLNGFCGGYIVFNLKKIRKDNLEEKFVQYLNKNYNKIVYAEQDVLNICCEGKVKYLPLNYVTCTYIWDFYGDKEIINDSNYTDKEICDAMQKPIQLHYASTEKPWKYVDTIKSEEWFKYIVKTTFLRKYLEYLPKNIIVERIIEQPKKETTISRIKKYIKNNPTFFLKKVFYKKLFRLK